MRNGELECVHGVGHSAGLHGCDGCCGPLVAGAWDEGTAAMKKLLPYWPKDKRMPMNPYRQGENSE